MKKIILIQSSSLVDIINWKMSISLLYCLFIFCLPCSVRRKWKMVERKWMCTRQYFQKATVNSSNICIQHNINLQANFHGLGSHAEQIGVLGCKWQEGTCQQGLSWDSKHPKQWDPTSILQLPDTSYKLQWNLSFFLKCLCTELKEWKSHEWIKSKFNKRNNC